MVRQDLRIIASRRLREAIGEADVDRLRGRFVHIDVDAAALVHKQRAQIVDAVGVIGMLVGEQYAIEPVDLRLEQLLAAVGRAVDQDARNTA